LKELSAFCFIWMWKVVSWSKKITYMNEGLYLLECHTVKINWRFGETSHLQLQLWRVSQARNHHDACSKHSCLGECIRLLFSQPFLLSSCAFTTEFHEEREGKVNMVKISWLICRHQFRVLWSKSYRINCRYTKLSFYSVITFITVIKYNKMCLMKPVLCIDYEYKCYSWQW
jgi:hypothetical protein